MKITKITKITKNKKQFIDLLLLGDEQESMIDAYLERGEMFVLKNPTITTQCVVTHEGAQIYEIKNIATYPEHQNKGYAKQLIQYILSYYKDSKCIYVGTGANTSTVSFYEKCGFEKSHLVKNFFVDNYDHPMFDNGKQLIDMIYLKWEPLKKL